MDEEINSQVNVVEQVNRDDLLDGKPCIGMCFDSEQHAYDLYNGYGGNIGFSIRREWGNPSRKAGDQGPQSERKLTSRLFVCSKEGVRRSSKARKKKSLRADTRTDCLARMGISWDSSLGKYVVHKFIEEHNHDLIPSNLTHMLPSQRNIHSVQASQVEMAADCGIPLRQSFELSCRQSGGRECVGFSRVDVQNHLRTRRQKDLESGEVGWLMNYFEKQLVVDPSFVHAVQLDVADMITNIFWADSKMVSDYAAFGDVLSFDTTYKIVQCNRPFAVFIGLNQHRQTTVFGAALMYDETADSFAWLFATFLRFMCNKAPKTIFTDQDAAMAKALSQVMPHTTHLLCCWHLMQNVHKHAGAKQVDKFTVKGTISHLMFGVEDVKEFDVKWDVIVKLFGLQNNKWIANMYDLKHVWGKAYVKGVWTAAMRSTQVSESFNGRLKQYLARQYALPEFFQHFDTLLYDRRYKDLETEYGLLQKLPNIANSCMLLTEVGKVYTSKFFDRVEAEYMKACMNAQIDTAFRDDEKGCCLYEVGQSDKPTKHVVTRILLDDHLTCSCMKFESEGIMCMHTLKVMKDILRVHKIPQRYILKRWTRNAKEGNLQELVRNDVCTDERLEKQRRHKILCRSMIEVANIANVSSEAFETVMALVFKMKTVAEQSLLRRHIHPLAISPTNVGVNMSEIFPQNSHANTSTVAKAKGIAVKDRTKGQRRRLIPTIEKVMKKKKQPVAAKISSPDIASTTSDFLSSFNSPSSEFTELTKVTENPEYSSDPFVQFMAYGLPSLPPTPSDAPIDESIPLTMREEVNDNHVRSHERMETNFPLVVHAPLAPPSCVAVLLSDHSIAVPVGVEETQSQSNSKSIQSNLFGRGFRSPDSNGTNIPILFTDESMGVNNLHQQSALGLSLLSTPSSFEWSTTLNHGPLM